MRDPMPNGYPPTPAGAAKSGICCSGRDCNSGKGGIGCVLKVESLTVTISAHGVTIVQPLSFEIGRGEMVALVGESGSGKSITCRALMGLLPANIKSSGHIAITGGQGDRRVGKVAMVFQDPVGTLNPVRTIGFHLREILGLHSKLPAAELRAKAVEALHSVRIRDPEATLSLYPHQLSGGMNQRVGIALALAADPLLLLADEPTSSLDTTTQAETMDLIGELREKNGLAVLFVTHDLGLVNQRADRVIVMYGGQLVESGPAQKIFTAPTHPYTAALLRSIPKLPSNGVPLEGIPGQVPAPGDGPFCCRFSNRCPKADDKCFSVTAPEVLLEGGQLVRCHYPISSQVSRGGAHVATAS
ncbi:MAG: ABC transporter ATP-binding protein [Mesorhizobium sp.]|nr:MAG: ABC transporter ATP-binding protein [Mesorhizobium sp.]RWH02922.1 MAG: ABC transporter ATP-binding protein [Mesorhizobium sp.]TIN48924.1 MAG: ABC transporter ATP-binding protein [Mesorhizobium sp.]TIR95631.1 MAG: ABC transporter ATP-binding protein [Mesorhizobium sp.]TIS04740.1 MAG: ABC transporter ATP-binding protein [Mesorhizobium sp.]